MAWARRGRSPRYATTPKWQRHKGTSGGTLWEEPEVSRIMTASAEPETRKRDPQHLA